MAGHRYWRITLDATTPTLGLFAMSELQFREVAGVPQRPSGGTMTARESYPGLDPNSVCDGNTNTYWASNSQGHQPQWLSYDYGPGNAKTIVEMAIIAEPGYTGGADAPTSLTPAYSDDGVNWTYLSQVNLPPLPDYGTVVFAVPTTFATNLVAKHAFYATRNDISTAAGMQFSLLTSQTFNRVGAMCGTGTLGPQTIILKNVTDNVEVARVIIDMTGGTAKQYYWANIPQVTLIPGKTYNLWALVTAGGGYYYCDDQYTTCNVYQGNAWSTIYGSGNGTVGAANAQLYGLDLDYVSTTNYVDLAGDLPVSLFLWADHTEDDIGVYGGFALDVAFAADVTVIAAPRNYVDLAGNLGGVSSYGRRAYGLGKYSRIDAFAPSFAGDVSVAGLQLLAGDLAPVVAFRGDLVLLPVVDFAGGIAPVVAFAGDLTAIDSETGDLAPVITFAADLNILAAVDIAGDLFPQVAFAADLSLVAALAGDLAPQIALGALLGLDQLIQGDLTVHPVLAGSTLTAGPLWASSTPCPSPPWSPTDPCPPTMWTPDEPCDPVDWEETELCNG